MDVVDLRRPPVTTLVVRTGSASAPRWFLQAAMARLDRRRTPVIAIGR